LGNTPPLPVGGYENMEKCPIVRRKRTTKGKTEIKENRTVPTYNICKKGK
jgi:hypothetical protein